MLRYMTNQSFEVLEGEEELEEDTEVAVAIVVEKTLARYLIKSCLDEIGLGNVCASLWGLETSLLA